MLYPWYNLAMLALESQQVINLRLLKFVCCQPGVQYEANLMVQEKMDAMADATTRLMTGQSSDSVVLAYRRVVHANVERLTHRRARLR
jgi:hypothetical protein